MDFLKLNYALDSAERSNLWVLLYTTPCSAHFYVGRNCPHNPNFRLSTSLIVTIRDRYAFEQTVRISKFSPRRLNSTMGSWRGNGRSRKVEYSFIVYYSFIYYHLLLLFYSLISFFFCVLEL